MSGLLGRWRSRGGPACRPLRSPVPVRISGCFGTPDAPIGVFQQLSVMLDLAAFTRLMVRNTGSSRVKEVAREWRNGRRAGFRCQCPKGRGRSNPPSRTQTKEPRSSDRGSFLSPARRRCSGLRAPGRPQSATMDIGKPKLFPTGVMLSSCQPSADALNVAICGNEYSSGTLLGPLAAEARCCSVNSLKWTDASAPLTSVDSTVTVVEKEVYQNPKDLKRAFDCVTTGRSRSRLAR